MIIPIIMGLSAPIFMITMIIMESFGSNKKVKEEKTHNIKTFNVIEETGVPDETVAKYKIQAQKNIKPIIKE
jgi:hypothetical protein